jgi:uncharacterized protein
MGMQELYSETMAINDKQAIKDYLDTSRAKAIRDPLWKHIYFNSDLYELIGSEAFHSLSRIKQLGPAYMVYPGATHTRFSHSLGVYHIASRMLHLLLHEDQAIRISLQGAKAFLCASLLHDLGHFPYAHSLKELPLIEHEILTARMIREAPLRDIIRDRIGTDPEMVASIVSADEVALESEEIELFRNILSGVLDPDKLDYLNRDAYYCGVPYGLQDIDYALSRILLYRNSGIAIDQSGITVVENILFSKYLMYKAVYWHRAVRTDRKSVV